MNYQIQLWWLSSAADCIQNLSRAFLYCMRFYCMLKHLCVALSCILMWIFCTLRYKADLDKDNDLALCLKSWKMAFIIKNQLYIEDLFDIILNCWDMLVIAWVFECRLSLADCSTGFSSSRLYLSCTLPLQIVLARCSILCILFSVLLVFITLFDLMFCFLLPNFNA